MGMEQVQNKNQVQYISIDGQIYMYNNSDLTLVEETGGKEAPLLNNLQQAPKTNVTKVSNAPEKKDEINAKRWDDTESLCFLDLIIERKENLHNKSIVNKSVYMDISKKLAEKRHNFTSLQCENRLKTLMVRYKEIIDHNSKTGNSFVDWKYFNSMEVYIGDKDTIKPKAKCSSLSLQKTVYACASTSGSISQGDGQKQEKPRKKVKLSPKAEMLKWLKEYEKNVARREQERREASERHHSETMGLLEKLFFFRKKHPFLIIRPPEILNK